MRHLLSSLFLALLCCAPAAAQAPSNPTFNYMCGTSEILYDPANGNGNTTVSIEFLETTATTTPSQVVGWSFSLAHDPAYLTATAINHGAYVATFNGGTGPDFWAAQMYPNGISIGAVYSFFGTVTCIYDIPKETAVVAYATVPSALVGDTDGEVVPLTWHPGLGSPPVANEIVVNGIGHAPALVDGAIELTVLGPQFVRGDTDGSGALAAIADGIWMLAYLFNAGPLDCFDAGDVNDDGSHTLQDPIFIFNWGFSSGPEPFSPFPSCGTDPTTDTFDCVTSACP
ncbi:MAG: hypothetical protein AAF581_08550 [Planctomycetota bacterium]